MTGAEIARRIEHSLLRADAREADISRLCDEARRMGFYSVCVNPAWIWRARALLDGAPVRVTTVVGFPLGATLTKAKCHEAASALDAGADELDIVINIGAALDARWDDMRADICAVVEATPGSVHKAILECCLLPPDIRRRAAEVCVASGVEYLKTSTGFSTGGATVQDVRMLRDAACGRARVKAAGGIRTLADFLAMSEAGADLIGTSSGPAILMEAAGSTGQ